MRTMIAGYYGYGNLGDELILSRLLADIRRHYPVGEISVLSMSPARTARWHRVSAFSRWNPLKILWGLFKADTFILGGGGLLQDKTSFLSIAYYLLLVGLARVFRVKVLLYAVGVDSIRRRTSRWLVRSMLNSDGVSITVRDPESKAILQSVGLPAGKIFVTRDPVFGSDARSSHAGFDTKRILFIPRFPCSPQRVQSYKHILEAAHSHGMKMEWTVFEPLIEIPIYRSSMISDLLPISHFLTGSFQDDYVGRFSQYDLVISARFHGLVFASLAGVRFVGVGDPDKVGRFCNFWNMPFIRDNATLDDVAQIMDLVKKSSANPRGHDLNSYRDEARKTFEVLTGNYVAS